MRTFKPSVCAAISFFHCIIATVGLRGAYYSNECSMLVTNVRDYKIRLGIVGNEESDDLYSLAHSATLVRQPASR